MLSNVRKMVALDSRFQLWKQVKIARWQMWRTRSLRKHGNALSLQKFTNWQSYVCGLVVTMKREDSYHLQFSFELASLSFSNSPGLQDNICWFTVAPGVKLPSERSHERHKAWWPFPWFWICSWKFLSLLETVACVIPHRATWFHVDIRKTNFHQCYDPIKKIWFGFELFKHFCGHFVSTSFLIVIIFFGTIFAHFPHIHVLCNNLMDRTLINIKFFGDYSNCETWILTNESPHKVDVCVYSQRGVRQDNLIENCYWMLYASFLRGR